MKHFRRIAILNRGEAAVRFVRTLRDLDLERDERTVCVGLVTEPDAGALFTRIVDELVELGPALRPGPLGPISAYCDHGHVLAALIGAGCDAVWPGWGFASEDPVFVERLEQAGIAFIGPPSSAMRELGDKIRSKHHAEAAGLPVAPWAEIVDDAPAVLAALGERLGFPLMVKASAGGGGRGIRRVGSLDEFVSAVPSARGEALRAFGDGRLFGEVAIAGARHVEVQFVVDASGVAHAIGIRDCSVQRRNQKLIEETPPPFLPDDVGRRLLDGTARMAAAVGYRGVGTAEFLFRAEDGLTTFLEVNSRLQVEHTITEQVSGTDFVRAQLLVARGLPWEAPSPGRGHAMQARVNAENPDEGFRPSPGAVRVFRPATGPGIRIDAGVSEGTSIAGDFDSMVAKVIVDAPTRDQAIARLRRALQGLDIVIEGGATNKAFLGRVLASPEFRDGSIDTAWVDRNLDRLIAPQPATEAAALAGAAILEFERQTEAAIDDFMAQAAAGVPQNLPSPNGRLINLRLRNRTAALHVFAVAAGRYEIAGQGGTHQASFERTGEHSAMLVFDGIRKRLLFATSAASVSVEVDGVLHAIDLARGGAVLAPAPAMVVEVFAGDGDVVRAGDRLAMLEAMKMELPVHATEPGVVRAVRCRPSEQVAQGQILFELETTDRGAGGASSVVTLPAAPVSPMELVFANGLPQPERLDDAPPELVRTVIDEVVATLRAVMLGYDVSEATTRRIELVFGAKLEFPDLQRADLWAPLVELLGVFADTEELFGRELIGVDDQATEMSAQLAYYEYCRLVHQGDGTVPELVRPTLQRALAHYGVDSFEPTPALRAALWRLAVAHAHAELRHRLCSSLLRIVIGLADRGVPLHGLAELPTTLTRVFEAASDEHPYVADNARQAVYVLYKQPLYVSSGRDLQDTHDLISVEGISADEIAAEYYDQLAATAQTVLPHLLRVADVDRADAHLALFAMIRRVHGMGLELSANDRVGDAVVVRCGDIVGVLAREARAATGAVNAAVAAGATTVDVFLATDPYDDAGPNPGWKMSGRVDLATLWLADDHETVRVEAYRFEDGRWVDNNPGMDVHPAIADRLELSRLSEFELERIPASERMVAFKARARSNPRDERVFVRAEVFGDTDEGDEGDDWPRWEFEKVYYEGLRVIREAQAGRGRRDRFYRNRLTVYVRRAVAFGADRVGEIARALEAPTRRLGLESVNVRTSVVRPDGSVAPVEFVISKPGRHRLDVRTREPAAGPIAPLSPYEQRVVRARRLGLVYPYEVVEMLEGKGSEAGETVFHVDKGLFVELDLDDSGERLVPVERARGLNKAGIIVGLITNETDLVPEGMQRVFLANDPTRALGSLAEPECRRVVAAIDLAEQRRLPIEWIATSSGAKIAMDSGTENLDWTAVVLRRIIEFTQRGGEINVIVNGVNVGAQAYWNAEATMLMHTRGALIMTHDGAMVLTGKRALEYSGSVSAEDEKGIGGADRIMGPNGQAHYVARDLGHAYSILFERYRFTYVPPGEAHPRRHATRDPSERCVLDFPYDAGVGEFTTIGELFDEATNPGRKKPFAMRALMRAVIDQDGGHLERWRPFRPAEMIIVWDAAIGGHAVSLIAVESRPLPRYGRVPADGPKRWTGATLFPKSSKKLARALNAASGNRPVVVLANLSGFDGSPESLRKWQLEYGAEIGRAVANFEGTVIFVVVGRYHGGAYVVFSKALNPGLQTLALEGSYASVIGGGPAAAVVFPREVRRRASADPEVAALAEQLTSAPRAQRPALRERYDELYAAVVLREQHRLAAEFDAIHSVQRAVEVGSLDAVVPPARLRLELVERLDRARSPG